MPPLVVALRADDLLVLGFWIAPVRRSPAGSSVTRGSTGCNGSVTESEDFIRQPEQRAPRGTRDRHGRLHRATRCGLFPSERPGTTTVLPLPHDTAEALAKAALAVSLEPRGGSMTGQPSGPVLFTGRLMPVAL
jgi:hypothetical protein